MNVNNNKITMFNNRVIIKGVNMLYTSYNTRVVQEHKRNTLILNDILILVDIKNIKYHMHKLNKQLEHIPHELFINLYLIKQYKLNKIQLRVLYNNLLFNGYIK